jgi:hypothetical protein
MRQQTPFDPALAIALSYAFRAIEAAASWRSPVQLPRGALAQQIDIWRIQVLWAIKTMKAAAAGEPCFDLAGRELKPPAGGDQ